MLTKQILLNCILGLSLLGTGFPSAAAVPQDLINLRTRFLQAESALSQGKTVMYQKLKSQLKIYPLYPYLLFNEYDRNIQTLPLQEFQAFMEAYHDTPLAEQLRSRWLYTKAKQEDWHGFLKAYIP